MIQQKQSQEQVMQLWTRSGQTFAMGLVARPNHSRSALRVLCLVELTRLVGSGLTSPWMESCVSQIDLVFVLFGVAKPHHIRQKQSRAEFHHHTYPASPRR